MGLFKKFLAKLSRQRTPQPGPTVGADAHAAREDIETLGNPAQSLADVPFQPLDDQINGRPKTAVASDGALDRAALRARERYARFVEFCKREGFVKITWCCASHAESCKECMALNGTTWVTEHPPAAEIPLPTCKSPIGCHCQLAAVHAKALRHGPVYAKDVDRLEKEGTLISYSPEHRPDVQMGRYDAMRKLGGEIAKVVRREMADDRVCVVCHEHDGDTWDRPEDVDWWPGKDCESPMGCRGDAVIIFADEGTYVSHEEPDESELERLASQKFGEAGSRQKSEAIALYRETRRKYLEAWSCEKEKKDIPQAVSLYRETLQIHKSIGEMYSVGLDWLHMDWILNRLSLVLAENGRADEAVTEIAAYRATGRESAQSSDSWNAIVKREARLRKRLARRKAEPGAGVEL